ncbi:MAG: ADP-ribosylglycohydrolase family protein [Elusimicrobiota bacterium]|jgi:ADP-ribosylglycohydrolase
MADLETLRSRFRGSLLGLAAGDALGTTLEFKSPGSFAPISGMVGGGPFRLKPGQWTDDTSMALCLAESLVERRGFDPVDQLKRYCAWMDHGHMSSRGDCFDIGGTCKAALRRFQESGEKNPACGLTEESSAGNGSIMRLAPVPLAFAALPKDAVKKSGESSMTTHAVKDSVDACRYLGGLITAAVRGASKEALVSERFAPVPGMWKASPLSPAIDEVAMGSFKRLEPPKIKGTGHVVRSLEAALWAFHKSSGFEHGALLAVNLGDDADTTGAVYGQLAGAFYGEEAIPEDWRKKLAMNSVIAGYADKLLELAQTMGDL